MKADPKLEDPIRAWKKYFDDGWHGVTAEQWLSHFIPSHLKSQMQHLDEFEIDNTDFKRTLQRLRREVVGNIIRAQHLLPWNRAGYAPFYREVTTETDMDLDHPLPVSQLKSLVLMAWDDKNEEEAIKRLNFGWLLPTTKISRKTHRSLTKGDPRRCQKFDKPLSRYEGIEIVKYNGEPVDAANYTIDQVISDLKEIDGIPTAANMTVLCNFDRMLLPTNDQERAWTKKHTAKFKKSDLEAVRPDL